jgi:predicted DNA-binding transcriptional regulator AlpA
MQGALKRLIVKILKETADKIEAGNCELSDSEAMDIMSVLSHQEMSKEDACVYLNMSRSKFDTLVRENKLPKGRKKRGFNELRWYKDEIDKCLCI